MMANSRVEIACKWNFHSSVCSLGKFEKVGNGSHSGKMSGKRRSWEWRIWRWLETSEGERDRVMKFGWDWRGLNTIGSFASTAVWTSFRLFLAKITCEIGQLALKSDSDLSASWQFRVGGENLPKFKFHQKIQVELTSFNWRFAISFLLHKQAWTSGCHRYPASTSSFIRHNLDRSERLKLFSSFSNWIRIRPNVWSNNLVFGSFIKSFKIGLNSWFVFDICFSFTPTVASPHWQGLLSLKTQHWSLSRL